MDRVFGMVYCVAKNCRTKSGQGIHLFTFPKDSERRELWIGNINRENFEPAPHSRLCALHFTPDQFVINPELAKSIGYTSKRNDLKDTAVPTVFKKDIKRKKSNSAQLKTLDLEEKESQS
ncbi:hypothetical protein KUTeg_001391 [Tegillarca granosa]|uniref:THAP-type domain-containing protein n=1 Tax=Tegillarca granosa TaxID=220873 RepID=A0ABQ9FR99_TEGGR|nr:hypothetical protein KUTeg_001391 [Tegillarca granosa]